MIRLRRCVFCPARLLFGGIDIVRFSRDVYKKYNQVKLITIVTIGVVIKQFNCQYHRGDTDQNVQRVIVSPIGRGMIVV